MSKTNQVKSGITIFFTWLTSALGNFALPVYTLMLLSTIDYVTGLIASMYRNIPLSPAIGLHGIAKKISMLILVMIAWVMDWLLIYTASVIGIRLGFEFAVACIACIWLICNELISILENIKDIGVPLPPFLLKIAKHIKNTTGDLPKKETTNENSN